MAYIPVFLLWVLSSFGLWANPEAKTYEPSKIGVIKTVIVGKMDCSGRLIDIEHFQSWCIKAGRVVYNQVSDMHDNSVVTAEYYDNKPNEKDAMILWMLAYIEGNPKTVGYQIAYSIDGFERPVLSGQF